MRPAEALALAMKREQEAAEFYLGLARAAADPALRAAFEDIARMELGHKARLEGMYVDVGYPEAF
jgi:rubrerythrin